MKRLLVSVPQQKLTLFDGKTPLLQYPVSTSKFGLGSTEGSHRTPIGNFRICEKYGAIASTYTIFKGRKSVGQWTPEQETEEDLVLSRILRLESTEQTNQNTYQRYIYFHGTNQESLLGKPASHGCIRLSNTNIIELFEYVPVGTPVLILD